MLNKTINLSAKAIQLEKKSFFSTWCWDTWPSTHKTMRLDPYLTPHTKINSKWIKDLDVRAKTMKLLENIGVNLCDFGLGNSFSYNIKSY